MTRLRYDALVYGGGPAALEAARGLATEGYRVALVGPVDASRWPTFATGGIETGSDEEQAFLDTIVGGDFLAERAPVRAMMKAAPSILEDLETLGVPFARDGKTLRLRRLDGMRSPRAAFVEARTTRAVTQALDDDVTRLGVERLGHHALEAFVADNGGRMGGCILQDRVTMEFVAVEVPVLVLALGGAELSLGASPTAVATEAALALAFEAGAVLANMEFLQTAPAAVWLGPRVQNSPRGRRALTASSALLGEGATCWLPRDASELRLGRDIPRAERRHFLEDAHPGWGLCLPSDLATRLVRREVLTNGLYDRRRDKHQPLAYLDVSHLPAAHLRERVGSELDLYHKLSGADPYRGPLPIHPALADRLGGLWVDFEARADGTVREDSSRNHATSLAGVFACGGSAHLYHGANRLSGNLLLGDLFGARCAARAARAYREGIDGGATDPTFARAMTTVETAHQELSRRSGGESPIALQARLRELLHARAGFSRDQLGLDQLVLELEELSEAIAKAGPRDDGENANRGVALLRDLEHAAALASVTAQAAVLRRESRGVHHRSDSDERRTADEDDTMSRPKPRLSLARRDDRGVRFEDSIRLVRGSTTSLLVAAIDDAGVTETTHPRRYTEAP